MTQAPAGWYPDPEPTSPRGSSRWWDGARWTEHVHAPATASRPAGPTTPDGVRLSGWWWRVLAAFVDGMVLTVVTYLLTLPVQQDVQQESALLQAELQRQVSAGGTPDLSAYLAEVIELYYVDHVWSLVVFPMVTWLVYHAGFLRYRGATPGKVVCGLEVRLREAPGRLPWGAIGLRVLVQYVGPWLVMTLALATRAPAVFVLVGLALFVFSLADALWATGARRQTLHDRAARTVVVRP